MPVITSNRDRVTTQRQLASTLRFFVTLGDRARQDSAHQNLKLWARTNQRTIEAFRQLIPELESERTIFSEPDLQGVIRTINTALTGGIDIMILQRL